MNDDIKGRPKETPSLKGRHFFLTIPHFATALDSVVQALKENEPQWGGFRYAIVRETHKDGDEDPHIHLYIGFPKVCRVRFDRFDYLGKHGDLQKVLNYSAVLNYMTKENQPRANFDYIADIMRKDFPRAVQILLAQGLHIRQIYTKYSTIVASKNWAGHLRWLAHQQDSQKFVVQRNKSGIRLITDELIKARLSDEEYSLYHSNPIFPRIVNLINDTVRYGCNRPHKAKALFLTGKPDTGKTTLGLALSKYMGAFTFPDDGWWQGYQSNTFKIIIWNEFDLRRMRYPALLKFLEGLRMDLPIKGSHITRSDNPLIILTSNLPLEEHICQRFSSQQNRAHSRANLGVRIEQVDIGQTPLFMLLKLLVSPAQQI